MTSGTIQKPFIDTTTNNLIIDLAKVYMRLAANGSTLRSLQHEVGEDKKLRDKLIRELSKRATVEHNLELPFGQTMESIFEKPAPAEDAEPSVNP